MDIKKTVQLQYVADDKSFAMSTILKGDGATPVVQTMGFDTPSEYKDDGTPVYNKPDDTIKEAQKEFMAAAIAELETENERLNAEISALKSENEGKNTEK